MNVDASRKSVKEEFLVTDAPIFSGHVSSSDRLQSDQLPIVGVTGSSSIQDISVCGFL